MELLTQLRSESVLPQLADLSHTVLGSDFQLAYNDIAERFYPVLEQRYQGFIERELEFVVEFDVALYKIIEAWRIASDQEDNALAYIDEAETILLGLYARARYLNNLACFLPVLAIHIAFCHSCNSYGISKRHWIEVAKSY